MDPSVVRTAVAWGIFSDPPLANVVRADEASTCKGSERSSSSDLVEFEMRIAVIRSRVVSCVGITGGRPLMPCSR
jgi:hypothetical protein